ncbi:Hypothetical protein CINCED_3A024561 [Cinara cedri]|uniref:Uncharacterized protein n=1 Tax=Cinara cedri TaxID=506608 RepID=A0A5E4MR69_9HEMI|nr:Hypothetical protein CINCED_3A024561 [Cinara cedri]
MNSVSMRKKSLVEANVTRFKWTPQIEKYFLFHMINLKPFGIKKFINVLIIQDNIREQLKISIPFKCIFEYLNSRWNIEAADSKEMSNVKTSKKLFELPKQYKPLIKERLNKIKKKKVKYGVNDRTNKIKLHRGPSKTRIKSVSSVYSKNSFKGTGTSSTKVSKIEHEEIPNIRRSLRTFDKSEEKELQGPTKKTKKLTRKNNKTAIKKKASEKKKKNIQNQNKGLGKKNAVSIVKRKNRNISESSFSSDNSKQYRYLKNNRTDLNISDSSSRSVTPEITRRKTSNRSVTPETNSRKTNLRSGDKGLKSKLKKRSSQFSNIQGERYKSEMLEKPVMELKSKNLVQNKNDLKQGKNKTRGRLTADLMVAQQSPAIKPLGRRSCCYNKNA